MKRSFLVGCVAALLCLVGPVAPSFATPVVSANSCGVVVHTPPAGMAEVTLADVGLPVQAAGLVARANKVHAHWLSAVECRPVSERHSMTPAPSPVRSSQISATAGSTNWSGYYVNTAQAPSSVSGSWTEPSVLVPQGQTEAHSAVWVGMGGFGSGTQLIQDGTGQDISSGSAASHYFWFESYPQEPEQQVTTLSVAPGDPVSATASWTNGQATFGLCNYRSGTPECVSFSEGGGLLGLGSIPAPSNTVEWIVEAPNVNGNDSTLAAFSPVQFSNAAYQAPSAQTLTPGTGAVDIVMVDGSGSPIAVPSALGTGGFTDRYVPRQPIGVGIAPRGQQQLFLVNNSGHLVTSWQTAPGGNWTGWTDWSTGQLGGQTFAPNSAVGVGKGPDGSMEIYLIGNGGSLLTMWQKYPAGSWTGLQSLGTMPGYAPGSAIAVGIAANREQELYLVDGAGSLRTMWQTAPGGSWTGLQSLNGVSGLGAGAPVGVGYGPGGVQEIYAVDPSGAVKTMWQTSPNGSWTALQTLNGFTGQVPATPISLGAGPQGQQELYFVNGSGQLMTAWQNSAGGTWTPLVNLNGLGGLQAGMPVGVGKGPDGSQEIYQAAYGDLLTMWQTSPGGTWTRWTDWGTAYNGY